MRDRTAGQEKMKRSFRSVEFEAQLGEKGEIVVPGTLFRSYGLKGGTKVHVRVTEQALSSRLRQRGVTEEEIQQIATVQRESREQVVKFLLSEGVLHDRWHAGRRRKMARRR